MTGQENLTPEQQNELLFMQLIMMFQGMAMQNLGKVMNPMTQMVERNLEQAKNFIDLLGMIDEKTKGNLTENEAKMLEHTLFELRMNFVEESKRPDPTPEEESEQTDEDTEETQDSPVEEGEEESEDSSPGEEEKADENE